MSRLEAGGGRVALVVSSDLNHYLPREENRGKDDRALDALLGGDPAELFDRVLLRERISMCGVLPATALLEALRGLPPRRPRIVARGDSGRCLRRHEPRRRLRRRRLGNPSGDGRTRKGELMRVANLSAEVSPFAKTGGLGDVVSSLPKALAATGHDVDVWAPFFLEAAEWFRRRGTWPEQELEPFDVSILGAPYRVGILRSTLPGSTVPVHFVAHDPLFHRPGGLYARNEHGADDGVWRFSLFVRAAVEAMKRTGRPAAGDPHARLAPRPRPMLGAWSSWRDPWFDDVASVLTIHNVGYQGIYGPDQLPVLGLPPETWTGGLLEHSGALNMLKGAIVAADMVTTVSPTYAWEIRTPEGGAGLDGVLRLKAARLTGILNGIDRQEWNPESDPFTRLALLPRRPQGKARLPRGALPPRRLRGRRPGDDRRLRRPPRAAEGLRHPPRGRARADPPRREARRPRLRRAGARGLDAPPRSCTSPGDSRASSATTTPSRTRSRRGATPSSCRRATSRAA